MIELDRPTNFPPLTIYGAHRLKCEREAGRIMDLLGEVKNNE